ncbi:MAG: UvrD-helicase domain-containing protein [Oligoflexia bacterium]|nr:UvrD-helicase domain-containing protein [Oligoflexia bacterium]
MSAERYLQELNTAQREAAETIDGPVIVLAGAGSGKTKTLISRIAYLIQNGVSPSQILAVTFTNKAAGEMKERVQKVLSNSSQGLNSAWAKPWMGFSRFMPEVSTFHSFCVKLLRNETTALGYDRPFVIYDDDDQVSLLKKILKSQDIDPKNYKRFKAEMDQLKCQALGPNEIETFSYTGQFGQQLQDVYQAYQNELRASQALDFGDLIVESVKLFKKHPEILEKYQEHFRYLMIDEYQDTNRAQYLLISMLAKKFKNICVVGDEDQSIYKWRGADIRNILDFQKDYPEAKLIKLEQNYRSTKTIIEAASAVIKNNQSRYDKKLWTANSEGEKIHWIQSADERGEAEVVAKEIDSFLRNGRSYNEIAVFYRSHAQSRALEESFRRLRIGYKIIGGVGFYERKEIKDALAYLRVLVNPDDSVSLLRIINVPSRGIGKSSLEKAESFSREKGISLYYGLKEILSTDILNAGTRKKILDFLKMIDSFRDLASRSPVSDTYHHVLEATGYVQELRAENTDESKGRIQNLEEFDTVIQFFEEENKDNGGENALQAFLNQVTLEASLLDQEKNGGESVSFMTLHSSKGLEFPLVFLVGCEEGIFPSRQSMSELSASEDGVEEERRLFYVGVTRAKEKLVLTNSHVRRIYGQVQVSPPSRFLEEIPEQYLRKTGQSSFGSSTMQTWQNKSQWEKGRSERFSNTKYDYSFNQEPTYKVSKVESDQGSFTVGQKVRHEVYGNGVIRLLEGGTDDRKITIEFNGRLKKKFSLKHVQLETI